MKFILTLFLMEISFLLGVGYELARRPPQTVYITKQDGLQLKLYRKAAERCLQRKWRD